MKWLALILGVLLLGGLLVARERLFGGQRIALESLVPDGQGGFQSLTLHLEPSATPLVFLFRARLANRPNEFGQWNHYQATLSRHGQPVASARFNVNYTGETDNAPVNADLTMIALRATLSVDGDYQLRIAADGATPVTVLEPQLEVRRAP